MIVLPEDSAQPVKFSVSGRAVAWIVAAIVLLVSANFVFLAWNLFSAYDRASAYAENRDLHRRLELTRQRLDSLKTVMSEVVRKNEVLYTFSEVPEPERTFAVGGPQLADYEGKSFTLAKLEFNIDSLLFVARQELEGLDSVEEVITRREKILRHTPSIKPMRGFYSSGFGKRLDPFTGKWKMHEGLDICAPKGTPVYATADGRVKFAGWEKGFGKVVVIDHIWFETRYAHLNEIKVRKGQRVRRGDIIGTCGRTGRTTGPHLHYEVRIAGKPVNPRNYILPASVCVD